MNEHPINQPIRGIDLPNDDGRIRNYAVGVNGVTRIEACEKSGQYSHIPYIRVWKGDACEGEFCQHNIVGVYFTA